jgi:hypothetical protein
LHLHRSLVGRNAVAFLHPEMSAVQNCFSSTAPETCGPEMSDAPCCRTCTFFEPLDLRPPPDFVADESPGRCHHEQVNLMATCGANRRPVLRFSPLPSFGCVLHEPRQGCE